MSDSWASLRRWGTRAWGPLPERVWRTLTRLGVRIDLAEANDDFEYASRLQPRRERVLRLADRLDGMEDGR